MVKIRLLPDSSAVDLDRKFALRTAVCRVGHVGDSRYVKVLPLRIGCFYTKLNVHAFTAGIASFYGLCVQIFTFDDDGTLGHIIDPRTGRPGGRWAGGAGWGGQGVCRGFAGGTHSASVRNFIP